jgi:hypothetical protein
MAPVEVLTLMLAVPIALIGWFGSFFGIMSVREFVKREGGRGAPAGRLWLLTAAAVGAVMLATLRLLASEDVRSSAGWTLYYLLLGYAMATVGMACLRLLGVHRADVVERGNRAASTLYFFGIVSTAVAFAGANVGDGPGVQVVHACALVSVGSLWMLVFLHALIAHTGYRILVDRDRGIAFRAGCMFIAIGAILGRSVAGDWTGFAAATGDFLRLGWPAVLYVVADTIAARVSLSREVDGNLWADRTTGVVYLLAAVGYIFTLGAPV